LLDLGQAADYHEDATIEQSINAGFAMIHIGTNTAGARFVMVNDYNGDTVVTEGL
jgi:hypothetical protein